MTGTGVGFPLDGHVPQKTSIVAKAAEAHLATVVICVAIVLELVPFHAMVVIHVGQ